MLNDANLSLEPIAIVGLGCRYAGAPSPRDLWRVLVERRCTLREVPPDRFDIAALYDPKPGTRGRVVTREGGFLEDIRGFDAGFFQISPREAAFMDPQQRQLLEVSWDALEDAGVTLDAVSGARVGVYVGLFTSDYRERLFHRGADDLDVYCEIGTTRSSATGRIAHAFNLTGPTVTVDGACASSLLAVHLACKGLWARDTPMAIAGGCNVVLEPEAMMCMSRSQMLSPESRCRFGDASASGFVRSDGVGVVVLKRLSDALRDGDRVYALLRASQVTNDARLGKGLYMTPSQEGQAELLRRAWIEPGFDLERLAFIEAHGTGTRAGDPVECGAIAEVLGAKRASPRPLYLGSVKTNIGHAEGAAGMAGLLKAALALREGTLPASLHCDTPNPDIPWEAGRIRVATEPVQLPEDCLAGVSAFGLSGTNAHVVLERFRAEHTPVAAPATLAMPVTAHDPNALRARARDLARAVREAPDLDAVSRLCAAFATRRTQLAFRGAAVGATPSELADALEAVAAAVRDEAPSAAARVVLVFPGQGGQWVGMGRELLARSPAFRESLEALDEAVRRHGGPDVLQALRADDNAWTRDPSQLQPVLFAVEVALAAALRALGVTPAAVVGHSMGEVAAACVAGALSLDDAARVMCVRSRCLARLRGHGRMAVLGLSVDEAARFVAHDGPDVAVAVSNSPASTVISGARAAVESAVARAAQQGLYAAFVDVDAASHSPLLDPHLEDVRAQLEALRPRDAAVPFFSTVRAAWTHGEALDPAYWCANLRQPVRFLDATRALAADGYALFVEVGPHPVLLTPLVQTLREAAPDALAVGVMRREEPQERALFAAAAQLYARGVPLAWGALYPDAANASSPPYPFQHESYWFREGERAATREAHTPERARATAHPFLGEPITLGRDGARVWEVRLSCERFPYLADHLVRGSALFPGAGFVELALAAGASASPGARVAVEDLRLEDYLVVPSRDPVVLQVQLESPEGGRSRVRFYSFEDTAARATLHAEAWVCALRDEAPAADAPFEAQAARMEEALRVERARASLNRDHRYAVLRVSCSRPQGATSAHLAARLAPIVRRGDEVFALADDACGVLLRGISPAVSRAQVAARLRGLIRERLADDALPPHAIQVHLVDADGDPAAVVDAARHGAAQRARPTSMPPAADDAAFEAREFYEVMEARGVVYGPAFRPVVSASRDAHAAAARLEAPAAITADAGRYVVHPALLDGFFQAAAVPFIAHAAGDASDHTWLPVGVRRVVVDGASGASTRCRAWLRPLASTDDTFEVDLVVTRDDGAVALRVDGLRLQRVARKQGHADAAQHGDLFHAWRWVACELAAPARSRGAWVVTGTDGRVHARVASALARRATVLDVAAPDEDDARPWSALQGRDALAGIALVLEAPGADADDARALSDACVAAAMRVVHAVRAARRAAASGTPLRMAVVTRGAASLAGDPAPHVAHAGVLALARVVANECPELEVRAVDLAASPSPEDFARVADALLADTDEDELAVRGGALYAHRLVAEALADAGAERVRAAAPGLQVALVSSRDAVAWRELPPPRRDEAALVIEVAAAVTAPSRDRAASLVALAGTVLEARGDVALRPGERVVALAGRPDADGLVVARRMAADPALTARVPEGVSLDDALVVAARYAAPALALRRVAGVGEGDRVFVHHADGAEGRAVCEVARALGATVLASAAASSDRAALRAAGVAHALDSAQHELADAVLDLGAGSGVDALLVLGDGATAGLRPAMLAPGARVLHLAPGADTTAWAAAANVTAGRLDVAAMTHARPAVMQAALRATLDDVARGALTPRDEGLTRCALGAAAEHVAGGARALWITPDDDARAPLVDTAASRLRRDGTYLVTGGLGGIGLALGAWLAEHGAGHLVLVGRSGRVTEEARRAIEAAEARGATVTVARAAADDPAAMAAVLDEVARSGRTLRGVFHLAGVLDDATLDGQSAARFEAVMRPKVQAAWNLHRLTAGLPLDHFVLFGSAAATIGSPGQANYAAANGALEALAQARRAAGLPALCLAWGVWAEVGLAAQQDNRGARLHERGLLALSTREGLAAFGRALLHDGPADLGVFGIDWARWARAFPRSARAAKFAARVPASQAEMARVGDSPRERLLALPASERDEAVLEVVRATLSEVLRVPASRLSPAQSLTSLGLDSLMTVELRGRLLDTLRVDLSPGRLLAAANVVALAALVRDALAPAPARDERTDDDAVPAADLALAADIVPRSPGAVTDAPEDVLLTGATGFLGVHLLRALLDHTAARVRCLVRAPDPERAWARLVEAMRRHGVARAGDEARVEALCGDLEAPLLGLSPARFEALAAEVDTVVHSGAAVNHVFPYVRLRAANVLGTAEALRFACTGRRKAFHHVSTLVVFPFLSGGAGAAGVDERSPLAGGGDAFFAGYSASKWAAERLVEQARARGLDARIYRPAQITGSTAHALCPAGDVFWRLVGAALELGAAPALSSGLALVPVDFVARAIVSLAADARAASGTFHLLSPEAFPAATALDALRAQGYALEVVAPERWVPRLARAVRRDAPVYPVLHRLESVDLAALDAAPIRCASAGTMSLLPEDVRALATVTRPLFERYVAELARRGDLPRAPARGRPSHPPTAP